MRNLKQETIADIVAVMRDESHAGDESCLEWVASKIRGYADRIEAAAKRERESGAEASHQREVAELRECLKETMVDAVAEYKNNSCFRNVKCGEIKRCDTCKVMKWRKALKGVSND